jgi:hypothetical protein
MPTLSGGASTSGQVSNGTGGNTYSNGVSAFGRAELYPGVDVNASTGYALGVGADDRITGNLSATGTIALVPYPTITFTSGATTSRSDARGGGAPSLSATSTRLDATVTWVPFPVLYLSAGVARVFGTSTRATTLANFAASYSPLRDGALLLSLSHGQTFDTATQARNRFSSASVRWKLVSFAFLEGGASLLDADSPQVETSSRSVFARLSITL